MQTIPKTRYVFSVNNVERLFKSTENTAYYPKSATHFRRNGIMFRRLQRLQCDLQEQSSTSFDSFLWFLQQDCDAGITKYSTTFTLNLEEFLIDQ